MLLCSNSGLWYSYSEVALTHGAHVTAAPPVATRSVSLHLCESSCTPGRMCRPGFVLFCIGTKCGNKPKADFPRWKRCWRQERIVTHLEDPLEGVQVADLTLHNGTQDETSHNLKHDENSAALESAEAWGVKQQKPGVLLWQTAGTAGDRSRRWWRLTHTHTCWLLSPSGMGQSWAGGCFSSDTNTSMYPASSCSSTAKASTQTGLTVGGGSAGGNSASIWSRLSSYTHEVESPDALHKVTSEDADDDAVL